MILTFDKIKALPFDECKISFLVNDISVIFVIKTKYINYDSIVLNADRILIDSIDIKKAKVILVNGHLSVIDNTKNSITFNNDSFETYHIKIR